MATRLILILTLITTSLFAQKKCNEYTEKYIPINLIDALNYLDCSWTAEEKNDFKNLSEDQATSFLHMSLGLEIRNSWGLWKGNSEISNYFKDLKVNHPDDMSNIILTSFYRYLNNTDLKLEEQIKNKIPIRNDSLLEENKIRINEFSKFKLNDTVKFLYPYGFISETQKNKYINNSCSAKGLIVAKDTIILMLQIYLIESCDEEGIILYKGELYEIKEKIRKLDDITTIMQVGETRLTNFEIWETIE